MDSNFISATTHKHLHTHTHRPTHTHTFSEIFLEGKLKSCVEKNAQTIAITTTTTMTTIKIIIIATRRIASQLTFVLQVPSPASSPFTSN